MDDLEEFKQRFTACLEKISKPPAAGPPPEEPRPPEDLAQAKRELVDWLKKNWWPRVYPGYDPERGFDAGEEEEGDGGGERR